MVKGPHDAVAKGERPKVNPLPKGRRKTAAASPIEAYTRQTTMARDYLTQKIAKGNGAQKGLIKAAQMN